MASARPAGSSARATSIAASSSAPSSKCAVADRQRAHLPRLDRRRQARLDQPQPVRPPTSRQRSQPSTAGASRRAICWTSGSVHSSRKASIPAASPPAGLQLGAEDDPGDPLGDSASTARRRRRAARLAAEVVVERAAGDPGGAHDLLGADPLVAALGEERGGQRRSGACESPRCARPECGAYYIHAVCMLYHTARNRIRWLAMHEDQRTRENARIELTAGRIRYREAGPGRRWSSFTAPGRRAALGRVVDALADRFRCIAPDRRWAPTTRRWSPTPTSPPRFAAISPASRGARPRGRDPRRQRHRRRISQILVTRARQRSAASSSPTATPTRTSRRGSSGRCSGWRRFRAA